MKKVYLLRHAKSSWKNTKIEDFDRPLNQRGFHDAALMAKVLLQNNIVPDIIVSSPANRAHSTSIIIQKELKLSFDTIKLIPSIYESGAANLLTLIQELREELKTVFFVGHNPGFSYLAEKLTGENMGTLPTCGIVGIEFPLSNWQYISQHSGTCIFYEYPKKHY